MRRELLLRAVGEAGSVRSRASRAGTSEVPNERSAIVFISTSIFAISRRPSSWIVRAGSSSVVWARTDTA